MTISYWQVTLIIGAYFFGSIPFGYLIAKGLRGIDIRTVGSGNIGATNVSRILGKRYGLLVFALDVLKGLVPALIGARLTDPNIGAAAGLAAVVGHNWSFFLGFRGGKGVATSCGIFLALFPKGVIIAMVVWAGTLAVFRYVSVSSMLAAVALAACAILLQKDPFGAGLVLTGLSVIAAGFTIVRHRSNIAKLMAGTEDKIGSKSDAP